jgi:uncharacterized CHY-type Zn-finger protein
VKWIRKFFARKPAPQAGLTFTSTLGKRIDVGMVLCYTCKNYFFVTRAELETPKFCPYCGVNFGQATEIVAGEAMEEHIV